jgi:hypothetical protein
MLASYLRRDLRMTVWRTGRSAARSTRHRSVERISHTAALALGFAAPTAHPTQNAWSMLRLHRSYVERWIERASGRARILVS